MNDFGFEWNTYKTIEKEIFIDLDTYRREFLVYIIDHTKRKIITYRPKSIVNTIDLVLQKYEQFNIERVGIYGREGYMYLIYDGLYHSRIYVYDRVDIYRWRINLPTSIKNRTFPIYYYEVQEYNFILEDEYVKLK